MRKLKKIGKFAISYFNRFYPFSLFIVLAVFVLLALGQTVNFYFWVDDWDLFLKVLRPELGPWGMAPGPFGSGPYRYTHTPFVFLYPFFGMNAGPYFAIAIVLYFIASLCVYALVNEISQKKSLALASSIIFASLPYIGSYTIAHLSNSYQMIATIILTCFTIWSLARHYHTGNYFYYFLAIFLYWATLEFVFLRAHGIIFMVLGFVLLFVPLRKNIWHLLVLFFKQIPFLFIYLNMYKQAYGGGSSSTLGGFFKALSEKGAIGYLISPFGIFSNILIPDVITGIFYKIATNFISQKALQLILVILVLIVSGTISRTVRKRKAIYYVVISLAIGFFLFNQWVLSRPIYWSLNEQGSFIAMFGVTLLCLIFLIAQIWWDKSNREARLLLFGVLWIYGQYIGYFIAQPGIAFLGSIERYLTPGTVGSALILGVVFSKLRFKKIYLYPVSIGAIACIYIYFMNDTASSIITNISTPTKRLYETLRKEVPTLPKDPVIYLNLENNPNLKYQVKSSFPATAFGLFYGLPTRANLFFSFEEVLEFLKKSKTNLASLVSFYVDRYGIVNTSETTHKLLTNGGSPHFLMSSDWISNTLASGNGEVITTGTFIKNFKEGTVGINPALEGTVNYSSIVPAELTLTMSVAPDRFQKGQFLYYDLTNLVKDTINEEEIGDIFQKTILEEPSCSNKLMYLQAEKERQDFLKTAKVTTNSEWYGGESKYLTDGRMETNWVAHRYQWFVEKNAEITIDLGRIQPVQRLRWVSDTERTTPMNYSISVSNDGKIWRTVKEVLNGPAHSNQEVVSDEFSRTQARYLKMVIKETVSQGDLSLSEIWVDSLGGEVNPIDEQQIISRPFSCPAASREEMEKIVETLSTIGKARIWWTTDSSEAFDGANSEEFPLIPDGRTHTYKLFLPAQGTTFQKIKMDSFQFPLNVIISRAQLRSFTFQELQNIKKGRGIISVD